MHKYEYRITWMSTLFPQTSYYTKRASLAAIYKSTELYLLQDKSPDYQDTWHFLNRRISDLESVGSAIRQVRVAG